MKRMLGLWLWAVLACSAQPVPVLQPQFSDAQPGSEEWTGCWLGGSGQGQWLECRFYGEAKHAVNLSGLSIASGYQKTPDSYLDNARPKSLKLVVNGATWAQLQLADSPI